MFFFVHLLSNFKTKNKFCWPRKLSSFTYFFLQLLSNFEIKNKFWLAQETIILHVFGPTASFEFWNQTNFVWHR
jgi:hypothetical protein